MWPSRAARIAGASAALASASPRRGPAKSRASTPPPPPPPPQPDSTPRKRRRQPSHSPPPGRRPINSRAKAADPVDIVGPASESREEHLRRHGGGIRSCPRCRYYRFPSWGATYGSFESTTGPRGRVVWLAERPSRWGGAWGIGCAVCAGLRDRAETTPTSTAHGSARASTPGKPVRARCGTKWARYEVRSSHLQSEHIWQHTLTDAHKIAVMAHCAPDRPVVVALQRSLDDDQLLSGAVPQPEDWLRAWRSCMDPSSWEQAGNHAQTEHFIAQIRPRSVQGRSFQAMAACMIEVLRERKRQWLREATVVFFGFDDKNGRKLLCFKADTPTSMSVSSADPTVLPYGARMGIVGCKPVGRSSTIEDYERDYAERTSEDVLHMLRLLCTPAGDGVDNVLFQSVLGKTRGIVVDGALLKTARHLRSTAMPQISIIMRDPAHILRTTCKDPLHDADEFAEQYIRLFEGRHALMKDIQYSSNWKDQLQACERELLRQHGTLGGGLTVPVRDLSFAQPRFESFVVPRRRYVCLLRPIAQLLATKAGDSRLSGQQRRSAQQSLEAMDGKDCFVAGLAGDYGEVCLKFLRYFDVRDHDPARAYRHVQKFVSTLRHLFVQGYAVCDPAPTAVPGSGTQMKTLAQVAVQTVAEPLVVSYGGKSWTLWGRGVSWPDCKKALAAMSSVATDVIERLMAEFHSDDLYMAYSAFDLDRWESALQHDGGTAPAPEVALVQEKLAVAARRFCTSVGVPFCVEAWRVGVRAALDERRRMRARASTPGGPEASAANVDEPPQGDNRAAWRAMLDANRTPSLAPAVRFYLATWDGTGQVERGLGLDAHIIGRHLGSHQTSSGGDDLYSGLLELKLDGPQREADVFDCGDAGLLYLTDFSRACALQWLLRHRRRFTCSQAERKDKGTRKQKRTFQGTDLAVQCRARSAHDALNKIAEADEGLGASRPGASTPRPTIFRGVDRANLMASVNRCPQPEGKKKTLAFRKNTQDKLKDKRQAKVWAGWTGTAATKLRLGGSAAIVARSRTSAVQALGAVLWRGRAARARQTARGGASSSSNQKLAVHPAATATRARTMARASTPDVVDRKPLPEQSKTPTAAEPEHQAQRTLDDMYRRKMCDPNSHDVLAWMNAVFNGGSVACDTKVFNLTPARRVPTTISLDEKFSRKHVKLSRVLTALAAQKDSHWQVTPPNEELRSAKSITKKRDLVEILLNVRRAGVPVAA